MTNRRDDPRYNAPDTISMLPAEQQRLALYARVEQTRVNYMSRYRSPPRPSLVARLAERLRAVAAGRVA